MPLDHCYSIVLQPVAHDHTVEHVELLYVGEANAEKFGMGAQQPGVDLYSRRVLIQQHARGLLQFLLEAVAVGFFGLMSSIPDDALAFALDEQTGENRFVGFMHQPDEPPPEEELLLDEDGNRVLDESSEAIWNFGRRAGYKNLPMTSYV